MKVQLITNTKQLSTMKNYPENVGHVFASKGEDKIFLITLIPVAEGTYEVRRMPKEKDFKYFLKKAQVGEIYDSFEQYLKEVRNFEVLTSEETKLLEKYKVDIELKKVTSTIFHALDWTETVNYNMEPKNVNPTIEKVMEAIHG